MAFPVPAHLPRKQNPQDVSSKILTKIGAARNSELKASLATEWIAELDESIRSTKQQIHVTIHDNLPDFERQLSSASSVQERLETLQNNVKKLDNGITHPETGLVNGLISSLSEHSNLAQETCKTSTVSDGLELLLELRDNLNNFSSLANSGQLHKASNAGGQIDRSFDSLPNYMKESKIIMDLRRNYMVAKSRAEEQLDEAYSRSVHISQTKILILNNARIRQSNASLSLAQIISSLPPSSLAQHMSVLRRDLIKHAVEHVLVQPLMITTEPLREDQSSLLLSPSPPNEDQPISRLKNLSDIFDYLSSNLFQHLPEHFARSLCSPISTALLNNLLKPLLPSKLDDLSSFLRLTQGAVAFEEKYLQQVLGKGGDTLVEDWVNSVGNHYERQRRRQILDCARTLITQRLPDDTDTPFTAEIIIHPSENRPTEVIAVQEDSDVDATKDSQLPADVAWGFDDEQKTRETDKTLSSDDADGWGFDDEVENPELKPEVADNSAPVERTLAGTDPGDEWGLNDEDEDDPWDDPWGEDSSPTKANTPAELPAVSSRPSVPSPKVATRLEKLAIKGKKGLNGSNSALSSPASHGLGTPVSPVDAPSPLSRNGKQPPSAPHPPISKGRPSKITTKSEPTRETYKVSGHTKRIISLIEDVLREGDDYAEYAHNMSPSLSPSTPGSTIFQASEGIVDLYRALSPVRFQRNLEKDELAMQFSNDCLWLLEETAKLTNHGHRLNEARARLQFLSDRWYSGTIEKQRQSVDDILSLAQTFQNTGEQDRYDECEAAVNDTVQAIKQTARRWKTVLPKGKYYTGVGLLVDKALCTVLGDILALPDIPEVESHRLSDLCKIFNSLEGVFVEDASQPSFVVAYVPFWLKFSYLSELLEASMADISYLFEEGALVDFDLDELATLVKALFSDNALRNNLLNKIAVGHPTQ